MAIEGGEQTPLALPEGKFLDAQASGETFAPEPVPPGSPIG